MRTVMDNFTHVTLLSNSSLKYYPTNSLSRFTVKLPNTINLNSNEKWYVGLTNVAHTSISEQTKITIKSSTQVIHCLDIGLIIFLYATTPKFYQKIEEDNFFDRYNSSAELAKFNYNKNEAYIQLIVVKDASLLIKCNQEYTLEEFFDIIFSQIRRPLWPEFIESFQKEIKNFKPTKQIEAIIKNIKDSINIDVNTKINPFPFYMCFYCNIIKPRTIGDASVQCLYMHPLGTDADRSISRSYQIDNVQYCPIEKYNISEISILITDETGEQINFRDGLFMTYLVLHFRKGI